MLLTKLIRGETKVIDADEGLVSAVASTEAKDRDGDIINQGFWDIKDFLKHPVLLSGHKYGSVRDQIGEWQSLEVKDNKLQGVIKYYINQPVPNAEADWAHLLATKGRGAYSVGFIPDMDKAEKIKGSGGGYEFKGQLLLEISHVTVPSNPEALQVAKAAAHPELRSIIDEMLEAEGDGSPHDVAALRDGIKQFIREIIAETGAVPPGVPTLPPVEAAPIDILSFIGGNHA